jgi:hypothetical protein
MEIRRMAHHAGDRIDRTSVLNSIDVHTAHAPIDLNLRRGRRSRSARGIGKERCLLDDDDGVRAAYHGPIEESACVNLVLLGTGEHADGRVESRGISFWISGHRS